MEAVLQNDPSDEVLEPQESHPEIEPKKCCSCSPDRLICISHALSAWGDRMWEFAVALYLVELTPGSLRLTAIFELVRTLCIIFLGPFVGNWVDGNPRLRVAKLSLVVQNIAVAMSAGILLLILTLHLSGVWYVIAVTLVMVIACLSVLAGIATKIAIEKDWVVVISGSDKSFLAATNAVLRRIDLVCKILAPALVGQIMTYVSKPAGVIFISAWNVFSVFIEYFMLLRVFRAVPALANKKVDRSRHGEDNQSTSAEQPESDSLRVSRERLDWMEREPSDTDTDALVPRTVIRDPPKKAFEGPCQFLKKKAETLKVGCHIYMKQSVVLPGLTLACLYFTVLSFSSITSAYIYTQNISESILSIVRGAGSIFGVLATLAFPRMRNRFGLVRSGLFSMSAQFLCMLLCLVGIFAPGSPFLALPDQWRFHGSTVTIPVDHNISKESCFVPTISPSSFTHLHTTQGAVISLHTAISSSQINTSKSFYLNSTSFQLIPSPSVFFGSSSTVKEQNHSSTTSINTNHSFSISPAPIRAVLPTSSRLAKKGNCTLETIKNTITYNFSYISISLIITGIILSRFGLWLSDLTISQLQQENVPEEERGIVGAMQKSFNSVLDMSIYVFVISLPKPEQFGILGIMSVFGVGTAGLLYAAFAFKVRGHLFHFEKVKRLFSRNTSMPGMAPSHIASSQDSLVIDHDDEDTMIRGILSTRNDNFEP